LKLFKAVLLISMKISLATFGFSSAGKYLKHTFASIKNQAMKTRIFKEGKVASKAFGSNSFSTSCQGW